MLSEHEHRVLEALESDLSGDPVRVGRRRPRPVRRWAVPVLGIPLALLAVLAGVALDDARGTSLAVVAFTVIVAIIRITAPGAARAFRSFVDRVEHQATTSRRYP